MGGHSEDPPARVDPQAEAEANLRAQIATMGQAAQNQYNIASNPNYGQEAWTRLGEQTRQNVFPHETEVRNQLVQNILKQLTSPTGLSAEQQAATDSIRGKAQGNLTDSMRTRANLGGGLYGGRSAAAEGQAVGDLQNQFAQEDITMQERNRLNNSQLAMGILQMLYPQSGIQNPNFVNPVVSADQQYGSNVSQRGQDISYQQSQQANQSALYQSLFSSLGQAGAGAMSAGGLLGCWVAAEIYGGWYHPKTVAARYYIGNKAPAWFRLFYLRHGEKIANFISNKPILKLMLRPLFEVFSYMGGAYVTTK